MNRLKKLKSFLRRTEQLPYLITGLLNIRYLTGFSGSHAILLLTTEKTFFITDSRYEEYARATLPSSVSFVLQKGDAAPFVKDILKDVGMRSLYIDDEGLLLNTFNNLKKNLGGIKLIPSDSAVKKMRLIKGDDEIALLREAAAITDRCFSHIKNYIKPGMTEWEVSLEIERFYKQNGCRKNSFDSIVASGPGSSMPHYETSMNKVIKKGEPLLIDMGCIYEGYNSDLTRTLFIGEVDPETAEIYEIVRTAQARAINKIKSGVKVSGIDRQARGYIEDKGYGENFSHSLGHGLGLEVHEPPAVKNSDEKLSSGMVITIEPGIYIPGKAGVRIEDMVLVGRNAADVLTKSTKDITIIK